MQSILTWFTMSLLFIILLSTIYDSFFTVQIQTRESRKSQESFVGLQNAASPIQILNETSREPTDQLILQDKDKYFAYFSQNDLKIRNASNITEYVSTAQTAFCPSVSQSIKKKLFDSCKSIEQDLHPHREKYILGISINSFLQIPWKFAITCDSSKKYENGFPHTRATDVIVLSESIVQNLPLDRLCKLLIHEKTHVYQKIYAKDMPMILQKMGFSRNTQKTRQQFQDPANPDLDLYRYTHNTLGEFYATYKPNPSSFTDIQYAQQPTVSKYEHPYEYIAYTFETIYKHPNPETISLQ